MDATNFFLLFIRVMPLNRIKLSTLTDFLRKMKTNTSDSWGTGKQNVD